MGRKKPTSRDDESGPAGFFTGGKLKKKTFLIADEEYSNRTESLEDVLIQEHFAPVGNKEKDKDDDAMEEGDDDSPAIKLYAGKKKSKGKKIGTNSVFTSSTFALLGEDEEREDNETKDNEDEDDVSGEPVIAFSGKKKPSKSKKCGGGFSSAFNLLDEEEKSNDKEEDVGIIFTGTEKSLKNLNKASGNSISAVRLNEENDEVVNISKTKFSGKKKFSKEKKVVSEVGNGDASSDFIEPTQHIHESNSVEIPPEEHVNNQPEVEEEKEGPVESVAAKKKKKKKEKEKAKKAAAAAEEKMKETETEATNKLAGKKLPKHVRDMQEKLARLKELDEKKKREEEEKHQKEEEERILKEEEEEIAKKKHQLKKEKQKEKLLKKKLSGKLFTGKQKERIRRMEAMRMQILGNVSMQLPVGETAGAPAKRPRYQKKNPKPHTQSIGAVALDSGEGTESKENQQEIVLELFAPEVESVEDVVSSSAKDKNDVTDVIQENGVDEDDEEWDAKSWDEADLKFPGKSAFADEEVDLEPEPLVRKEIKSARAATQDVELPSVATKTVEKVSSVMPQRFGNVDGKKKNSNAEDLDKTYTMNVVNCEMNRNGQKSDDYPALEGLNLRSPICCIMGHVDTGKTKLLDCIRGTNVQEGEAGGITQQIGATYFPAENIRERTRELKHDARLNVPGLLVIDTPGHESFTNLRSRGSMLCDVAVLVVDIMRGLEKQTIESLNLLKNGNTDFIVALNKVDKIFGWKTCRNAPIKKALSQQNSDVKMRFNDGLKKVKNQLQEQGLNAELYYKNKEIWETCNIVPTSAKSGEGIPDLLLLLVQWTQKTMIESLTYSDKVQCTVLEVKVVEGHGTTIDVVLVNGVLHEGDQIVVCGMQGPIVTSIRALLTPHPMKELRVKGTYLHHKEIKAAMGIKITAQGLENTIAGTSLYVVGPHDDLEKIKEAGIDMKSVMSRIDISAEGVCVQASTQGSLEALLEFLKTPAVNIPVSYTSIGPVHKKDVKKAGVMLEKKKEYGTILAFDVKVTQEARELADELGVKIFIADIIYHLFDQFKAYIDNLKEEKKKEAADEAVFPCVLKIMPNCVFNKKDPIVLGVDVLEGIVKIGTPLCVPQREFIEIGRIASIENNHKPVDYAKKGQKVAIKIIGSNPDDKQKMFGRHMEMEDELVSKITRNSLDALEENYADELSRDTKRLLMKLGKLFRILRVHKK
ncbi:hypothetical protein CASFOL_036830 [Castilleja foliolosa]|uniref:Eukaryotic translation initiation factor 5B n=1 Tax=Castilleja foliolosa TaxID=1961234 RepID=A0ABD3BP64_9LAMI